MLTITSRDNPQSKQVSSLLSAAKKRRKEGLFVCEGFTLLEEALRRGLQPKAVYCLESLADRLPKLDCPCALVNQSVLEKLSDVPAPQGVVFTLPLPEAGKTLSGSRFLALDSLRDPGNMGTILRTADALEIPVALLEGCADPYSHKVVRATMGAAFRTPVIQTTWAEAKAACEAAGIPVAVTALSDRAEDIRQANLKKMAVVIGSEGRGVRKEVLDNADAELIIPMNPRCESLNAAIAAAIVMWQMK